MNYKVDSSYGYAYLTNGTKDERGRMIETEIRGQLCSVNGIIGRLWSVKDSAAHGAGHGGGSVYGHNAILATPDMTLVCVTRKDEVLILE